MSGRAAKATKTASAKPAKRGVTGYILYATEVRSQVKEANPGVGFGDISKIVGAQWRELADSKKQVYVNKAQAQNASS